MRRTSNLDICTPFWGNYGWCMNLVWLTARWKGHGRLSVRLNWTFIAICYGSRVIRRTVYSLAVFAGGWPLCTEILHGQGHPPSTILGIKKLETLGYPMVKSASICILSFWHNTGVWWTDTQRQTDRQMDERIYRSIYSTCKSMFWRTVKTLHVSKKFKNWY